MIMIIWITHVLIGSRSGASRKRRASSGSEGRSPSKHEHDSNEAGPSNGAPPAAETSVLPNISDDSDDEIDPDRENQ